MEWLGVCRGAVRVSSTSITGKQITYTYVEPGVWFGDVTMFDGDARTHDAYAHGATTLMCVSRADFFKILQHVQTLCVTDEADDGDYRHCQDVLI